MRLPLLLLLIGVPVLLAAGPPAGAADPWSRVPQILERIRPPVFPERDVSITRHGAVGDGTKDCTGAFRKAIEACAQAGGGRVVVPAGRFRTGAIHLKSGVNLHVSAGATVLFDPDPARYLPPVLTRYEGNDCWNYSPFIYAVDQQNIAITGAGTIDGQGAAAVWKGMNRNTRDPEALRRMSEQGIPVGERRFGAGHSLRPNLVQFYRCRGILVEGVTLKDGPMWTVHPVLSANVTVRGVTIVSGVPNGDGVDPESCKDVHIADCTFVTRDDGIALKSGRNADGRRAGRPCENVVIQRCRVLPTRGARNGMAIGSEVSGGARTVFIEDCVIEGRVRGISLKTNSLRGGLIEDIYLRNLEFRDLQGPVLSVDMAYGSEEGPHPPRIRNVELRGARVGGAEAVWNFDIPTPRLLSNVVVIDSHFAGIRSPMASGGITAASLIGSTVNGRPARIGRAPLKAQLRNLLQDYPAALAAALLLGVLGCGGLVWRARRGRRKDPAPAQAGPGGRAAKLAGRHQGDRDEPASVS